MENIYSQEGDYPQNPDDLKVSVLEAWDNVCLDSFRELVRSYKHRLLVIVSVNGRHRNFV